MSTIEIDDDVYTLIKDAAEPFVDSPNSVLRRLLGLEAGGDSAAPKRGARAPQGSILPESDYELPILRALAEMGGKGSARDVTDAVGEALADRLTDTDRNKLKGGDIRWRNRVAFARLTLINKGQLRGDSPRGVWELTDEGRERAGAVSS